MSRASNILSRILPPGESPSVYETMRDDEQASDTSDVEQGRLQLRDDGFDEDDAPMPVETSPTAGRAAAASRTQDAARSRAGLPGGYPIGSPRNIQPNEAHDDVPLSLLMDPEDLGKPPRRASSPQDRRLPPRSAPRTDFGNRDVQAKWDNTQRRQRLHDEDFSRPAAYTGRPARVGAVIVDNRERAFWHWANVTNLDLFLREVYDYYIEKGIWSITLNRVLNLLTITFVCTFTVFLSSCINFQKLPDSQSLSDIYVDRCSQKLSGSTYFFIWVGSCFGIYKTFDIIRDLRRLREMHDFFHYLLGIPDSDIQTVSWQDIVKRLMILRDSNTTVAAGVDDTRLRKFLGSQSKKRMDAHDIANRIMRRENYLIALFNKEILDLSVPAPFFRNRPIFSRTLEWNLSLSILDFVFDNEGQVRPIFLKESQRRSLSNALRRRFIVLGIINIFAGPIMVLYSILAYSFKNFSEYQKDPSQIGSRSYTPFAEWKFREFNELWHLFDRRMNMSYPMASHYINQFPKDKTVQLARFVTFITSAMIAVLVMTTFIDPDLFLGFEITHNRTVLFYIGAFTTVWAIARGMIPDENQVFDPEFTLRKVIDYTHYQPVHWQGKLHSEEVRAEFAQLYRLRLLIFLEEILSMLTTPFIMCLSLPLCSERIVDFFREFTVHVDGLGHVCSFAVFDFERGGAQRKKIGGKQRPDLREDYFNTKDNKMLASYYNFVDQYANDPKRQAAQQNYQGGNRQYNQPQNLPGMMSSHFGQAGGPDPMAMNSRSDFPQPHPRTSRYGGGALGPTASQRTPRFPPTSAGAQQPAPSPVASLLLDPHHQPQHSSHAAPPPPAYRSSTYGRAGGVAQSKLRSSRMPVTDVLEDENEAAEAAADASRGGLGLGRGLDAGEEEVADEEMSALGESWKTTRAGYLDDEDDEDVSRGPALGGGKGGKGVLGLVYQFSKAQTEGRAGGPQL